MVCMNSFPNAKNAEKEDNMSSKYLKQKRRYFSVLVLLFFIISCLSCNTANAETSDTVKDGVGGGLIGALAGSLGGYAGAGALIGGGIGLFAGALSDSSKDKEKDEQQQVQDAYQKGLKDGSSTHYKEGPDRKYVDDMGAQLKN